MRLPPGTASRVLALFAALIALVSHPPTSAGESVGAAAVADSGSPIGETTLFPPGEIYNAPLASPWEPRTHMTWQRLDLDIEVFNVGSVGFGESFGIVRWSGREGRDTWQLGVSGAVFAQFNLDAPSMDLINADYILGIPLSLRSGPWSVRFRFFHQSSHLGDEFLLLPQRIGPVERINLSFETAELWGALEWRGLQVSAGSSYIVHTDTPLDRKKVQGAVTYLGPRVGWGPLRPVAGALFHSWEETQWDVDVSIKAGISLASPYLGRRAVLLLAEYFDGHLPYGQFFNLEANYWGAGISFVF